jgi:hypothetical protein
VLDSGAFSALGLVDKPLTDFAPLRLESFRVRDTRGNVATSQIKRKPTPGAGRDQSKSSRGP